MANEKTKAEAKAEAEKGESANLADMKAQFEAMKAKVLDGDFWASLKVQAF